MNSIPELEKGLKVYSPPAVTRLVPSTAPPSVSGVDVEFKQLVDKLAWAVGTTFDVSYAKRSWARDYAVKEACRIVGIVRQAARNGACPDLNR